MNTSNMNKDIKMITNRRSMEEWDKALKEVGTQWINPSAEAEKRIAEIKDREKQITATLFRLLKLGHISSEEALMLADREIIDPAEPLYPHRMEMIDMSTYDQSLVQWDGTSVSTLIP